MDALGGFAETHCFSGIALRRIELPPQVLHTRQVIASLRVTWPPADGVAKCGFGPLTVASLLRQDIALVVSHHSDLVRQRLLRWLHEPFERIVYDRASAVLTTSPMYIEGSKALRQH